MVSTLGEDIFDGVIHPEEKVKVKVRPYLFKTTNLVVSHLSRDLAKCNINTIQCITAADSVLGNRGAASERNSKLKLTPVQHHFLIISCSYTLNPAPAQAGFAKTKSGTALIYSAVIYGTSHMREFTVVPLGQSQSAPGGRKLVGQAADLTFESACRLL